MLASLEIPLPSEHGLGELWRSTRTERGEHNSITAIIPLMKQLFLTGTHKGSSYQTTALHYQHTEQFESKFASVNFRSLLELRLL